jgi:hypothetical protein
MVAPGRRCQGGSWGRQDGWINRKIEVRGDGSRELKETRIRG